MANSIFMAPSQNFIQTTLNGAITDTVDTITLNSITGFKSPGYVVIDRTDSAGTSTPSAREIVSYTGISGNDLTGCTRGADASTARTHSDGAIVETVLTAGMWNSLATIVGSAVDGSGYLRAIASPASIGEIHSTYVKTAKSLISTATVLVHLNASGASITGFVNLKPTFVVQGPISGASTGITVLPLPDAGNWKFFSAMINEQVSTASLWIDINLNGSSIFETGTRLMVPNGGTYVSTASINTKAFSSGQKLSIDIDAFGSADGYCKGVTVIGRST